MSRKLFYGSLAGRPADASTGVEVTASPEMYGGAVEPNIAATANLIGDPARAKMLTALMGGKALTATELAVEADITAQTASSHLTKLVNGQLLVVRKQGRHKYFQLMNYQVAELLEALLNVSSAIEHSGIHTGPKDPRLKKARICYDHLAGEISVVLYQAFCDQGLLREQGYEPFLTEAGWSFFAQAGADMAALSDSKRPICRSCLDWSERRTHLAGGLGQWLLNDILDKGWAERDLDSRAISFTQSGLRSLYKRYSISI